MDLIQSALLAFTVTTYSTTYALPSAYQIPFNDYPPIAEEGNDPYFSYHRATSNSERFQQLQGFPYSYHGFPYNYRGFPFHNTFHTPSKPFLTTGFRCPTDGEFYRSENSFYSCYNNEYHVMHCAPGSMNMPKIHYSDPYRKEKKFCSQNMVAAPYPGFLHYR